MLSGGNDSHVIFVSDQHRFYESGQKLSESGASMNVKPEVVKILTVKRLECEVRMLLSAPPEV